MKNIVNKFWGDLINYRPDIRNIRAYEAPIDNIYVSKTVYSTVISEFVDNSASSVVLNLYNNISILERKLEQLECEIVGLVGNIDQVSLEELQKTNDIIDGNSLFEVYSYGKNNVNFLKRVEKTYRNNFYGDMTNDEIYEHNEALTKELLQLEKEGTKINYASLRIDNILNAALKKYSDVTLKNTNTIINSHLFSSKQSGYHIDINDYLEEEYNQNKDIKGTFSKTLMQANTEVLLHIDNLFVVKDKFLDMIDKDFELVNSYGTDYDSFIRRKKDELEIEVEESLKNFIKILSKSSLYQSEYLNKFTELEKVKSMYIK